MSDLCREGVTAPSLFSIIFYRLYSDNSVAKKGGSMIFGAIAGAAAGMYLYYEVKEAVKAVHKAKEARAETARKLEELEEAKKTLEWYERTKARLEKEKAEADEAKDFYKDLCKRANLLIDPSASFEDFSRQLDNPNSVFVFDD